MLKIKDNIDLKELEKFGFVKEEYINDFDINDWYKIRWVDDNGNYIEPPKLDKNKINWIIWTKEYMTINEFDKTDDLEYKDREIINENIDADTLYDLIKADLVEKVDE